MEKNDCEGLIGIEERGRPTSRPSQILKDHRKQIGQCRGYRLVALLMKYFILLPLYAYRLLISPFLGQHCRFYPSCSVYAIAAVQNHGIMRGLFLSIKRLLKCHPWHPGGVDPVPQPKRVCDI